MNPSHEECSSQILVGADMATQEPSPELSFFFLFWPHNKHLLSSFLPIKCERLVNWTLEIPALL